VVTRLRAGIPEIGVLLPSGARNISLLYSAQTGSGAICPYEVGTGALSPGIKRPGRETDHSLLSGTKFKIARNYIFVSPTI
jgi:hypothetical protein